jgi:hypothetical protein
VAVLPAPAEAPGGADMIVQFVRPYCIAGTLILLFWAEPIRAAEMPKELWGHWCMAYEIDRGVYVKCKKEDDWSFGIDSKGTDTEEGSCEPLSVSDESNRTWIIKERCFNPDNPISHSRITTTTRYVFKGKRLHVINLK